MKNIEILPGDIVKIGNANSRFMTVQVVNENEIAGKMEGNGLWAVWPKNVIYHVYRKVEKEEENVL